MAAKKKSGKKPSKRHKSLKKSVGGVKKVVGSSRSGSKRKAVIWDFGIVLPKKLPVASRKIVVVYGMRLDPENITRAAIEAYNKKRYNVHDVRLTEHIEDPKFRNLMVKIAVLDRIEEEICRIYPSAEVLRPNTVTLIVR